MGGAALVEGLWCLPPRVPFLVAIFPCVSFSLFPARAGPTKYKIGEEKGKRPMLDSNL